MSHKNRKPNSHRLYRIGTICIMLALLITLFCACSEEYIHEPTAPIDTIPKNEYREEAFVREDGVMCYTDGAYQRGIDVSVHQGVIDWQAVAKDGVQFAILRLGYRGATVGELYLDEQFEENYTQAKQAGLAVGVYFFSQATDAEEAAEEAKFVCETLDSRELELPVFFDWELVDGGERVTSPFHVDLSECSLAFCMEITAQGYDAGVYFNQNYGYDHLNLYTLREYTLWLAEYNATPSFDYHFDCLQYTDNGSIDGIEGSVDLDLLIIKEDGQ